MNQPPSERQPGITVPVREVVVEDCTCPHGGWEHLPGYAPARDVGCLQRGCFCKGRMREKKP